MKDSYYDYDKFEWFLYYLFKLDNVDVKKVGAKGRGDGGADLILSYPLKDRSIYRIGIQAKYWKNRVGTAPINQLASAKSRHNLTDLWIITTSDLTSDAKEIAESMDIKILRADDVKDFIEKIKEKYKQDMEETGISSIEFLPMKDYKKNKRESYSKKTKNKNTNLIEAKDLRELRTEISKKYKMFPVYTVYNNVQMQGLLKAKPTSKEELLKVSGFGNVKVERFGHEIINHFKNENYSDDRIIDRKESINISKDDKAIEELKKLRTEISKKYNMTPVFTVYNNSQINNLIEAAPTTKEELLNVRGFGEVKVNRFGHDIIEYFKRKKEQVKTVKKTNRNKSVNKKKVETELKKLRYEISTNLKISPVSKVFTNGQIKDLIEVHPTSKDDFLKVEGLNSESYEKFGKEIIDYFKKCK